MKVDAGFGFYPLRLYGLSPGEGVFSADFYFWVSVPPSIPIDKKTFEAANGANFEPEPIPFGADEDSRETYWFRARAQFYHSFNFTWYPLDDQTLRVRIEHAVNPVGMFRFSVIPASHLETPVEATRLDQSVKTWRFKTNVLPHVGDWNVVSGEIYASVYTYNTDWGLHDAKPQMSANQYSDATMEFHLRHDWAVPLLSLLGPNLLFVVLALLLAGTRQERPGRVQALLGITAGAAGQHYAFMTSAPSSDGFRVANLYFIVTYTILILCGWYIFRAEQGLPTRYQWTWFGLWALGTTLVLLAHVVGAYTSA